MTARPVDASGDILPVMSLASLLSDVPAAASALSDHLRLFTSDWWEYPARGNPVFDLIASGPVKEKDLPALSACITSYILAFPPVQSVSDVTASLSGSVLTYAAVAHLTSGEAVPMALSVP